MPGAVVTMAHYTGGGVHRCTGQRCRPMHRATTGSVSQRILLGNSFVARAQVVADGYEEYWRSLRADGRTTFVENVRLCRRRASRRESRPCSRLSPDGGDCRRFMAGVCGVVRITIPKAGRLTVEAVSDDTMTERPPLEVCCESGNEV